MLVNFPLEIHIWTQSLSKLDKITLISAVHKSYFLLFLFDYNGGKNVKLETKNMITGEIQKMKGVRVK